MIISDTESSFQAKVLIRKEKKERDMEITNQKVKIDEEKRILRTLNVSVSMSKDGKPVCEIWDSVLRELNARLREQGYGGRICVDEAVDENVYIYSYDTSAAPEQMKKIFKNVAESLGCVCGDFIDLPPAFMKTPFYGLPNVASKAG